MVAIKSSLLTDACATLVHVDLFVQGNQAEVEAQIRRLAVGRSILDTVSTQVKYMERDLGQPDRDRIDQYFTSVRELESRLQASQGWEKKPKPVVSARRFRSIPPIRHCLSKK